jgi:hypothetical protein
MSTVAAAASTAPNILAPRFDCLMPAIPRHLEARGVPTPRRVGWTATAVRRALARIAARS